MVILRGVSWHLIAVWSGISLTVILGIFSCALCPSGCFLWTNVHFDLWPIFYWLIVLYIYICYIYICIELYELFACFGDELLVAKFGGKHFFPHFEVCLLLSFRVFHAVEKLLRLMRSLLLSFSLIFPLVRVDPKRTCCNLCQSMFCVYFPWEV